MMNSTEDRTGPKSLLIKVEEREKLIRILLESQLERGYRDFVCVSFYSVPQGECKNDA
jgi:hypothetical protein